MRHIHHSVSFIRKYNASIFFGLIFIFSLASGAIYLLPLENVLAQQVTRVGFLPGTYSVRNIALQGNTVYVADSKFGVSAIDVSQPSSPRVISSLDVPIQGQKIAVSGSYALVYGFKSFLSKPEPDIGSIVVNKGVYVVDISNPSSLRLRGAVESYSYSDLFVADDLLFALRVGVLEVIDFKTNPDSPSIVGIYTGLSNTVTSGIYVSGSFIYIANGFGGIKVIKYTKSPAGSVTFTEAGSLSGSYLGSVFVEANRLYIASTGSDIHAFDITIDGNNVVLEQIANFTGPHPFKKFVVRDGFMYAPGNRSFSVIDFRDLANITSWSTPNSGSWMSGGNGSANGLDVSLSGNKAYVATEDGGMMVVDVSNPSSPNISTSYNSGLSAKRVIFSNPYVVVMGSRYFMVETEPVSSVSTNPGFYLIDISNPSSPVLRGQLEIAGNYLDMTIVDDLAFVTKVGSLSVIDFKTNPNVPSVVGSYTGLVRPTGISVSGDFVYIANGNGGIKVLKYTKSGNAVTFTDAGNASGIYSGSIFVEGNRLYVSQGTGGTTHVYDISINANTVSLTQRVSFTNPYSINKFVVRDGFMYAPGNTSFSVIDFRDLANITSWSTPNSGSWVTSSFDVSLAGNTAYVATGDGGVMVVDVSNPSSPSVIESLYTHNPSRSIYTDGVKLYVGTEPGGLEILNTNQVAVINHTLTVTSPSHGTVSGGGINCGSGGTACSISLGQGRSVLLTATPDSGYDFTSWSVPGISCLSNTCSIPIGASDITVGATFSVQIPVPPVISNPSPTAQLAFGTTQATMSLDTNKDSTCRWSTTPGTAYSLMSGRFTVTGLKNHSVSLSSLVAGITPYYIRCQDSSNASNINTSDYIISINISNTPPPDLTPPTVPQNLQATVISSGQINLSWSPSTDNANRVGYKVYTISGGVSTLLIQTSATTYQAKGLTSDTSYTFAVASYDSAPARNTSALSSSVSARTLAGPPPPVTYVVGDPVTNTAPLSIFNAQNPNTQPIATQPINGRGVIVGLQSDQVAAANQGFVSGSAKWYEIAWADSGHRGWSIDSGFTRRNQKTFSVGVTKQGDGFGTITSSIGINCGSTCSTFVTNLDPTTITLTASANANSRFDGFTGCTSVSGSTCTITNAFSDISIQARFTTTIVVGDNTPPGNNNNTPTPQNRDPLEPVNQDQSLSVTNFIATPGDTKITLSWTNPSSPNYLKTILVRKSGSIPTGRTDGLVVYEGTGSSLVDTRVQNSLVYGYSIFTLSKTGIYSSLQSVRVTPTKSLNPLAVRPTPNPVAVAPVYVAPIKVGSIIPFKRVLRFGSSGIDVKNLQIFLNSQGTPVNVSGIGSRGKESTYFGPATQKALIKFQEKNKAYILTPYKLTKGSGSLNNSTMKFINGIIEKNKIAGK
jgi:hypothetical protein